jgi:hypothetical protein
MDGAGSDSLMKLFVVMVDTMMKEEDRGWRWRWGRREVEVEAERWRWR